ncbi:hypothetical protein K488DRAFT_88185 [Vararia minispora EC-137]|uniref:Uncharacterized protein n=1 Tax=Vararia minispora EC-137 TaxID=1314806 RepID=A0ACB8QEC9_9AGAM|nr:hypothetical protein K488DRAFT_88185 [Vararia minispora EC-137]
MSPPETEHRTSLPPELWLQVFELASVIPDELDPDIHDPFVDPSSDTIFTIINPRTSAPAFRSAVSARRSLVCVCKTWRVLATPLLYRTLFFDNAAQITELADTLAVRDLGVHVRRLELVATSGAVDFNDLRFLLSCLGNLQILHICPLHYVTNVIPSDLLYALADAAAGSLAMLIWPSWPGLLCKRTDHEQLLRACTRLRTLVLGPWRMDDACTFATPALPSLRFTALAEHVAEHAKPAVRFPALAHVFLAYSRMPDLDCTASFLALHGSGLTAAYVNVSGYHRDAAGALSALRACPRLAHVVLFVTVPSLHDGKLGACEHLPHVTHVGIHGIQIRRPQAELPHLLRVLARAMESFPETVKVLRVMNDLRGIEVRNALVECRDAAQRHGIELQGLRGEVFVSPNVADTGSLAERSYV